MKTNNRGPPSRLRLGQHQVCPDWCEGGTRLWRLAPRGCLHAGVARIQPARPLLAGHVGRFYTRVRGRRRMAQLSRHGVVIGVLRRGEPELCTARRGGRRHPDRDGAATPRPGALHAEQPGTAPRVVGVENRTGCCALASVGPRPVGRVSVGPGARPGTRADCRRSCASTISGTPSTLPTRSGATLKDTVRAEQPSKRAALLSHPSDEERQQKVAGWMSWCAPSGRSPAGRAGAGYLVEGLSGIA